MRTSLKFSIREYQKKDHKTVLYLHVSVMRKAGVYLGPGKWDKDLNDIENVYFKNKGTFLVGEYDGKVIAMGAFKKKSKDTAEIKRMRVHPDFQGLGFGQEIFDELEKEAKRFGYKKFYLTTSHKQIPAHNLYKKNGFKQKGRRKQILARKDLYDITFEKELK